MITRVSPPRFAQGKGDGVTGDIVGSEPVGSSVSSVRDVVCGPTYRVHAQYNDGHTQLGQLRLGPSSLGQQGLDLCQAPAVQLEAHGLEALVRVASAHVPVGQGQTTHTARRWGKVCLPGEVEERLPEVGPAVGCEEVAECHVLLKRSKVHFGRHVEPVPSLLLPLMMLVRRAAEDPVDGLGAAIVIFGAASSTLLRPG